MDFTAEIIREGKYAGFWTVKDQSADTYGVFESQEEAWKEIRILRDNQGPGGRHIEEGNGT